MVRSRRRIGRQILEAVDRHVDGARAQRGLDLACEQAAIAEPGQRDVFHAVAERSNGDTLTAQPGSRALEALDDVIGLPEGEVARARADTHDELRHPDPVTAPTEVPARTGPASPAVWSAHRRMSDQRP